MAKLPEIPVSPFTKIFGKASPEQLQKIVSRFQKAGYSIEDLASMPSAKIKELYDTLPRKAEGVDYAPVPGDVEANIQKLKTNQRITGQSELTPVHKKEASPTEAPEVPAPAMTEAEKAAREARISKLKGQVKEGSYVPFGEPKTEAEIVQNLSGQPPKMKQEDIEAAVEAVDKASPAMKETAPAPLIIRRKKVSETLGEAPPKKESVESAAEGTQDAPLKTVAPTSQMIGEPMGKLKAPAEPEPRLDIAPAEEVKAPADTFETIKLRPDAEEAQEALPPAPLTAEAPVPKAPVPEAPVPARLPSPEAPEAKEAPRYSLGSVSSLPPEPPSRQTLGAAERASEPIPRQSLGAAAAPSGMEPVAVGKMQGAAEEVQSPAKRASQSGLLRYMAPAATGAAAYWGLASEEPSMQAEAPIASPLAPPAKAPQQALSPSGEAVPRLPSPEASVGGAAHGTGRNAARRAEGMGGSTGKLPVSSGSSEPIPTGTEGGEKDAQKAAEEAAKSIADIKQGLNSLPASYKDPLETKLEGIRQRTDAVRNEMQQRMAAATSAAESRELGVAWARIGKAVADSLIQLGAAYQGLKRGLDISGKVKLAQVDWQGMLDNVQRNYAAQLDSINKQSGLKLDSLQKEAEGIERRIEKGEERAYDAAKIEAQAKANLTLEAAKAQFGLTDAELKHKNNMELQKEKQKADIEKEKAQREFETWKVKLEESGRNSRAAQEASARMAESQARMKDADLQRQILQATLDNRQAQTGKIKAETDALLKGKPEDKKGTMKELNDNFKEYGAAKDDTQRAAAAAQIANNLASLGVPQDQINSLPDPKRGWSLTKGGLTEFVEKANALAMQHKPPQTPAGVAPQAAKQAATQPPPKVIERVSESNGKTYLMWQDASGQWQSKLK